MPSKSNLAVLSLVAAVLLGGMAFGGSESLETLLAYLKSPNAGTRRDAARRLGERRVRDQLVVEALGVASRKDEDRRVRYEAVRSLGLIKDLLALPDMIEVLADPEPDVRRMAVKSLVTLYTEHEIEFITSRRTGWNRLNPFLDTNDGEIVEPYVSVEPQIIEALGRTTSSDHHVDVRIAAIGALGVLRGSAAIPQLAEALNADRDVRIDALRAFIKIGDKSAGPHLVPFFRDSDQKVRTQAMVAAGLLKYHEAVEPLLEVYRLGPERKGAVTRVARTIKGTFQYLPPRDEAALWALSLTGDSRAEQVFVDNLAHQDSDRRQYAVEGLARIGDPKHRDGMSRALNLENDRDVKLAMYWALYGMGSSSDLQEVVRKLDSSQSEQARAYLLECKNPGDLHPYIRSSNKAVRRGVIEILGRVGDAATIDELKPVVQTSGAGTADVAAVAVKRIEWRLSGRPRAEDEVLRREARPRRISSP